MKGITMTKALKDQFDQRIAFLKKRQDQLHEEFNKANTVKGNAYNTEQKLKIINPTWKTDRTLVDNELHIREEILKDAIITNQIKPTRKAKDWIRCLHPNIREKAMKAIKGKPTGECFYDLEKEFDSFTNMLSKSFIWDITKEGWNYWNDIHDEALSMESIEIVGDFGCLKDLAFEKVGYRHLEVSSESACIIRVKRSCPYIIIPGTNISLANKQIS